MREITDNCYVVAIWVTQPLWPFLVCAEPMKGAIQGHLPLHGGSGADGPVQHRTMEQMGHIGWLVREPCRVSVVYNYIISFWFSVGVTYKSTIILMVLTEGKRSSYKRSNTVWECVRSDRKANLTQAPDWWFSTIWDLRHPSLDSRHRSIIFVR